jgi:DNA-binding transcriptional LysR family regulator
MLKALDVFVAIVDAGNFSKAAQELDVAVSSVTRRLDALEEELGVQLLRRGSRKLVLTDAGEHFLQTARSVLAELNEARELFANGEAEPRGLLTIAAPTAFGRRHVAPAVRTFLAAYPLMKVDLQLSDKIVDLSVERVDLAVRIGRLADSELVATRLAPLRRLVCAAPAYLKTAGRPVNVGELVNHECLTVSSKPTPPGWWTFPGLNRGAPLPVGGRLQCDDTETLLEAAVAGLGIVHLASWLVSDLVQDGKLVSLFPPTEDKGGKDAIAIYAVRLPGRSHVVRARLFLKHILEHIGTGPYWDLPRL